jgi:nucleoside-diphosphate-sugar epimerase
MKILITGAGGYVGSELVRYLIENTNYKIIAYDLFIYEVNIFFDIDNRNLKIVTGDIRDNNLLNEALKGVDICIHLACISNDPSFDLNPNLGKSINYDCFPSIIRSCKNNGIKRFIYASSSSVYGVSEQSNVEENSKKNPLTDYSKYKLLCEEILLNEINNDFQSIIIRPATVCGFSKRLRLDLVVNIFVSHAYFNKKITIFGGNQLRPNINIRDMIRAYAMLIELDYDNYNGSIYNCGFDNLSLNDISDLVVKNMGEQIEVIHTLTDDNRSYHISSDKIKREINFKPKYDINDAINDLIKNFRHINNPFKTEKYFNIKL